MELALLISVLSICGFAGALSYNVYWFRKVGRSLDGMIVELRRMSEKGRKDHERMMKMFDRIVERFDRAEERFEERFDRAYERHGRMIRTLDRINESLASSEKR